LQKKKAAGFSAIKNLRLYISFYGVIAKAIKKHSGHSSLLYFFTSIKSVLHLIDELHLIFTT